MSDGGQDPVVVLADGPRRQMSVADLREAVLPGGALEFTHAGGTLDIPAQPVDPAQRFVAEVSGAVYSACAYLKPALIRRGDGREAVLIARFRYEQLLRKERAFDGASAAGDGSGWGGESGSSASGGEGV